MEELKYIENGDIALFFGSDPSLPMIASVVLQVQLAIFTLGFTYKILHGDLNSGNMPCKIDCIGIFT